MEEESTPNYTPTETQGRVLVGHLAECYTAGFLDGRRSAQNRKNMLYGRFAVEYAAGYSAGQQSRGQRGQRGKRGQRGQRGKRVQRQNWWEWVFIGGGAVYHVARDSRGFKVIDDFLRGHRPEAWGSDRLRAQRKAPAKIRQACLAHLLRDCNLAIETGDQCFAPRLKALLLEIIDLYWARDGLGPQDFNAQKQDLRQKIGTLFDRRRTRPWTDDGVHLQKQLSSLRDDLAACLDIPELEPTNNVSERAIRMSKVFLKVTGTFRTPWAADIYTAIRSIINTGQLHGFTPKQAIDRALNGLLPLPS